MTELWDLCCSASARPRAEQRARRLARRLSAGHAHSRLTSINPPAPDRAQHWQHVRSTQSPAPDCPSRARDVAVCGRDERGPRVCDRSGNSTRGLGGGRHRQSSCSRRHCSAPARRARIRASTWRAEERKRGVPEVLQRRVGQRASRQADVRPCAERNARPAAGVCATEHRAGGPRFGCGRVPRERATSGPDCDRVCSPDAVARPIACVGGRPLTPRLATRPAARRRLRHSSCRTSGRSLAAIAAVTSPQPGVQHDTYASHSTSCHCSLFFSDGTGAGPFGVGPRRRWGSPRAGLRQAFDAAALSRRGAQLPHQPLAIGRTLRAGRRQTRTQETASRSPPSTQQVIRKRSGGCRVHCPSGRRWLPIKFLDGPGHEQRRAESVEAEYEGMSATSRQFAVEAKQ